MCIPNKNLCHQLIRFHVLRVSNHSNIFPFFEKKGFKKTICFWRRCSVNNAKKNRFIIQSYVQFRCSKLTNLDSSSVCFFTVIFSLNIIVSPLPLLAERDSCIDLNPSGISSFCWACEMWFATEVMINMPQPTRHKIWGNEWQNLWHVPQNLKIRRQI